MNTRELDKMASLCKKLREQILKEGTQDWVEPRAVAEFKVRTLGREALCRISGESRWACQVWLKWMPRSWQKLPGWSISRTERVKERKQPFSRSHGSGEAFQRLPQSFLYYCLLSVALGIAIKERWAPSTYAEQLIIGALTPRQYWQFSFHPQSPTILSHSEVSLVKWNQFKLENLMMIFEISRIQTEQIPI